jgi:AraC-like DNA-binding protein
MLHLLQARREHALATLPRPTKDEAAQGWPVAPHAPESSPSTVTNVRQMEGKAAENFYVQEIASALRIALDAAKKAVSISVQKGPHQCGLPKDVDVIQFAQIARWLLEAFGTVVSPDGNRDLPPARLGEIRSDMPASIVPPITYSSTARNEHSPVPSRCEQPSTRRQSTPLPKWRLKRVVEYVDAHLENSVSLADLASCAGLTSMHFARQFRVATGIRPHEYLLRRRIARAQELLLTSNTALVEIAFCVGFQTQAHFTTVFKRFVGVTPGQWRRENYEDVVRAGQLRHARDEQYGMQREQNGN